MNQWSVTEGKPLGMPVPALGNIFCTLTAFSQAEYSTEGCWDDAE